MVEAGRKIMIFAPDLRERDAAHLRDYKQHSVVRNGLDHVEGVGEKDLVELEAILFTLDVTMCSAGGQVLCRRMSKRFRKPTSSNCHRAIVSVNIANVQLGLLSGAEQMTCPKSSRC